MDPSIITETLDAIGAAVKASADAQEKAGSLAAILESMSPAMVLLFASENEAPTMAASLLRAERQLIAAAEAVHELRRALIQRTAAAKAEIANAGPM